MTCVASPPPGAVRGELRFPDIMLSGATYSALSFVVWMDVPTVSPDPAGADYLSVVVEMEDGSKATLAVLPEPGQEAKQCSLLSIDLLSPYVGQVESVSLVFDTGNGIDNNHEGLYVDDIRLVEYGCYGCVSDVGCDDGDDCTSDHCLPFLNDEEHAGYCWNEPIEGCEPCEGCSG